MGILLFSLHGHCGRGPFCVKKMNISKLKRLGTLHHFCLQVQVTSCKCFHIMSSEESNSLQDNYCHIVWASDSVHVNSNSSRHLNHVAK